VELSIQVVRSDTGHPIPGADVELVHPIDDDKQPLKGQTSSDGRAVIKSLFTAYGTDFVIWHSEHVTFSPWVLRVNATGFSDFSGSLAPIEGRPIEEAAGHSLNLRYPVSGSITIALRAQSTDRLAQLVTSVIYSWNGHVKSECAWMWSG
jgi:hypothetical protein